MLNKELLLINSSKPEVTFLLTKLEQGSGEESGINLDINYSGKNISLEYGFGFGSVSKTVDYSGSYFSFRCYGGGVMSVDPPDITWIREGSTYHCENLKPGMVVDISVEAY